MSRVAETSAINIEDPAEENSAYEIRHLQAADPETLERLFAQLQDEMLARGTEGSGGPSIWRLAFIDLAGAGDGHVFTCSSVWVNTDAVDSAGTLPTPPGIRTAKVFFYMASQSEALTAARAEAQTRIAARFDEITVPPTGEVYEQQTMLAGAQQGTRFMGAVLTVNNQAPQ